jgi:hypothetical protein
MLFADNLLLRFLPYQFLRRLYAFLTSLRLPTGDGDGSCAGGRECKSIENSGLRVLPRDICSPIYFI